MDERAGDVDERAAAALQALREGAVSAPSVHADRWVALRALLDEPGPAGRRALASAAAVVAIVVVGALGWLTLRSVGASDGGSDTGMFAASAVTLPAEVPAPPSTEPAEIVVHAAGAVVRPGLYRLATGARVSDLLDAAGGPVLDTDLDRVNLAAPLADGQRVYVPHQGETALPTVGPDAGASSGAAGASGAEGSPPGPIDLNTATIDQLDSLPGVGPATASAIVTHRERNGPFASVEGLLDVRGIGPAKLEGLRDLVTVG